MADIASDQGSHEARSAKGMVISVPKARRATAWDASPRTEGTRGVSSAEGTACDHAFGSVKRQCGERRMSSRCDWGIGRCRVTWDLRPMPIHAVAPRLGNGCRRVATGELGVIALRRGHGLTFLWVSEESFRFPQGSGC